VAKKLKINKKYLLSLLSRFSDCGINRNERTRLAEKRGNMDINENGSIVQLVFSNSKIIPRITRRNANA
jgi:hypothetical protein